MHPQAQLGPCPCGSGERMVDCHMPMDDPCYCQSGKRVGECCAITAAQDVPATA